jgi:hypothetical protein
VANLNQRNAPLVQQECDGEITVTDPKHPLFPRRLKLAGIAKPPGCARQCQVELQPGQYRYVPVASTNLSSELIAQPTLLTLDALQQLIATFQALPNVRRVKRAKRNKSQRLEQPRGKRAKRGR